MKTSDTIHCVCNIDDAYLRHCIVTLTSLFENNPGEPVHVHIIAASLSDAAQKSIADTARRYGQECSFHIVGDRFDGLCPVAADGYISAATYFRCFLPSILPETVDKAIYIDCDLLVVGNIRPFWNIDIKGYAVGAVEDMWSGKPEHYQRLQYPESDAYFNAGVLLLNLGYWRENDIEEEIKAYIKEHPDRLLYNDQDALNGVLHSRRKLIPFRWNMQDGFFRRKRKIRPSTIEEVDREMPHTAIIHFTGSKKPWHDNCLHPCRKLYFKYLNMTPMAGWRPKINYFQRINRLFLAIQGALHLKNTYRRPPFKM